MNITGTITRSEVVKINPCAKDADYAQLNKEGHIQMWYKLMPIGYSDSTSAKVWHYLSFANIWMGSSDDMNRKNLLKVID